MTDLLERIAEALTTGAKVSKEETKALLRETVEAIQKASLAIAEHEGEIAATNDKITALTAQLGGQAAGALAGGASAREYNTTMVDLNAVKGRLAILTLALEHAEGNLTTLRLAQSRLTQVKALKTITKLAGQRANAAEALAAAIATTNDAWHALYDASERLKIAYPGGILPLGSRASRSELFRGLELEFYRVSGVPFSGAGQRVGCPALPGAKCHDVRLAGEPEKLPSIVDQINLGNDILIRHMTGEAARVETVLAFKAEEPEPETIYGSADDGLEEIAPAPAPKAKPKTRTALEIQPTVPKTRLTA